MYLLMLCLLLMCHLTSTYNGSSAREYVEKRFTCTTKSGKFDATEVWLVITPSENNLPLDWFDDVTLVPQAKNHSYPLTFATTVKGDEPNQRAHVQRFYNQPKKTCVSITELPMMFDDRGILETMKWLKDQCFQKVFLRFDSDFQWIDNDKAEIFISFMKLFHATYGTLYSSSSMGIIIINDPNGFSGNSFETELRKAMARLSLDHLQQQKLPPNSNGSDFLKFGADKLSKMETCNLTSWDIGIHECLKNGFFHVKRVDGGEKGGGTPWIGHPTVQEYDTEKRAKVSCYTNDLSAQLGLMLEGSTGTIQPAGVFPSKKDGFLNTTFELSPKTMARGGKYYCVKNDNFDLRSSDYVEFKLETKIWSQWSSWGQCDLGDIGMARISRTRVHPDRGSQKQEKYCSCSDLKKLPHPRIVLLGKTGVGKSTLGTKLFGDRNAFAIGHASTSMTTEVSIRADHYLGYEECFTIIDTPGVLDSEGQDYAHLKLLKDILHHEVESVDMFLLLMKGDDVRFSDDKKELLLQYQAIFGEKWWNHTAVEFTFWAHDKSSKDKRMANGELTEKTRSDMLRKKIMNMTSANLTNFVFIDPVVRVFEDHCHELKAPEVEELQAFWDWTAELRKFYFESDKEPFNCTDLCKAPDVFLSGAPILAKPLEGSIDFKGDAQHEQYIEWKMLIPTGLTGDDVLENTNITINSIVSSLANEYVSIQNVPGLSYKLKNSTTGKLFEVQMFFQTGAIFKGQSVTVLLENNKGNATQAEISWTKDGAWTSWTEWSQCSVSCIEQGGDYGKRSRIHQCDEGYNSATTCRKLGATDGNGTYKQYDDLCPLSEKPEDIYCRVNEQWGDWGSWSKCSQNCGWGEQTRVRHCTDGMYGGPKCKKNIEQSFQACNNTEICPDVCKNPTWSEWTNCPTCINEKQIYMRKKLREFGDGSSPDCFRINQFMEEPCPSPTCPIDSKLGQWSEWSTCSVLCGKGSFFRKRTCFSAKYGGKDFCDKVRLMEEKICDTGVPCPLYLKRVSLKVAIWKYSGGYDMTVDVCKVVNSPNGPCCTISFGDTYPNANITINEPPCNLEFDKNNPPAVTVRSSYTNNFIASYVDIETAKNVTFHATFKPTWRKYESETVTAT